MLRYVIEGLG